MSNRLPENEVPFRLVDPIAEEYRLMLIVYKNLLVNMICNKWLDNDRPTVDLGGYIAKHIGDLLVQAGEFGTYDGNPDAGIPLPKIPAEILDAICAEWDLPPYDQMLGEMLDDEDDELPDVFRGIVSDTDLM